MSNVTLPLPVRPARRFLTVRHLVLGAASLALLGAGIGAGQALAETAAPVTPAAVTAPVRVQTAAYHGHGHGPAFRTVAMSTDAPGQSDEHRCVVDYVKAHARTEHGATHANARTACSAPVAPATYVRTASADVVAPLSGVRIRVMVDAGDVALSADAPIVPAGFSASTPTPITDATGVVIGYQTVVSSDADTPDGAAGTASLTITVSDVAA